MSATPITLSWAELLIASSVGIYRHIAALKSGKPDSFGADPDDGWTMHVEGACGELAFARAIGRYWLPTINTFKAGGDGVGRFQVRTRRRSDFDLLIRPGDRDDVPFVLVTGRAPDYAVHGWILARDGKRDEFSQTHGNRPAAFFVPQSALHPLSAIDAGDLSEDAA